MEAGTLSAASTWMGPGGATTTPTPGLWSAGTNWDTAPTSGTTTALSFLGGSTSYVSTDDISGAFTLNSLSLNSTAGTIAASSGDSLTFDGTSPTIQQSAAGVFTISAPVTFAKNTTISAVDGGEIDFGGVLTSSNALNITNSTGSGNATVKLLQLNSIAASTNINVSPFVTLINTQTNGLGTLSQLNMTGGTFAVTATQRFSTLTDTGTAGTIQTQPGAAVIVGSTDNLSSTYNGLITEVNTSLATGQRSNSLKGAFVHFGTGTLTLTNPNNNQLATSVVEGTIIVAGNSTVTNGAILSPVGSDFVMLGSNGAVYPAGSALLLDNTPGRSLPNTVYFGSSAGIGTSETAGGLNTSGTDTFKGDMVLGSSNSGAFGITNLAILGATNGGEVDFTGNIIANHDAARNTTIPPLSNPLTIRNLSGTGNAIVKATGLNNNYTVGTEIDSNVTLVAALTTTTHLLGSGPVTLAGGTLALQGQQAHGAQQANIVTNSGFNQKIIVPSNGGTYSAGSNAAATTTSTFDGTDVLYASGYTNATATAAPFGLDNPVSKQYGGTSGLYTSEYNPDVKFQLQPYTSNNALQFQAGDFTTHTLNIATPAAYKTINILSVNNATATVTFNFADSTSETQTLVMQQYAYGNTGTVGTDGTAIGAPASLFQRLAIGGVSTNALQEPAYKIGSINRTTDAFTGDNPGIYEDDFTLSPADQAKTLNSISFAVTDYQGNTSSANILAISGQTYVAPATLSTQTYVNNVAVTNHTQANGTIDITGSLNTIMGNHLDIGDGSVSGAVNSTLNVISSDTSGSPYSLTLGTLPDTTDTSAIAPSVRFLGSSATFNVANSAGGGTGTLIVGALDDTFEPGSSQTITKTGAGVMTLSAPAISLAPSGETASVLVSNGTLNVNNPLALGTNADVTVTAKLNVGANAGVAGPYALTLHSLTVDPTGKVAVLDAATPSVSNRTVVIAGSLTYSGVGGLIDLNRNDLIVQNTDANTLFAKLQAGFNAHAGYWNGSSGIISTAAAHDTRFLTTLGYRQSDGTSFDGVTPSAADALVKYTYYGDADLNGVVNGADYQLIDAGFGTGATGWSHGDFNYDGVINGSDFALIDNTFNQITATGAGSLAVIASPSSLLAGPAVSAVPEPTTLGLLGVGAIGLLGRRRRRHA